MRSNKLVLSFSLTGLLILAGCGSKSAETERREEAIPVRVMVVPQGAIEKPANILEPLKPGNPSRSSPRFRDRS